ncbi:shikimate dehydrogenase [Crocinitomix sp.]|nr:shikimate dehydrogenase [Crocinitomix sp.]
MENSPLKYGLIGRSLDHSFSKKFFTDKFNRLEINAVYENCEIPNIELVEELFAKDYQGFNVTIPYKESIIPFLDELSPEAELVGAVNTIRIEGARKIGYNTDAFGFKQMIKPFFKSHHERAMILGTGGAAKAVQFVLEQLGVNVIHISRRKTGNHIFSYEDINDNMIKFNGIIVNCTPVGTFPAINDSPIIPYEFLSDRHLAIDLIYNPEETLFLKKAKAQGAWTLNGLTMLQQQAEEAWKIWNKK